MVRVIRTRCAATFRRCTRTPCQAPVNAGDADIKGIEIEATARPVEGLLIDASLSYLDFEYTDVDASTGVSPNGVPPYSPK